MALKALNCPTCGAKIQVDDSKAIGFCSYCGAQIMLKDIVEVRHVGLNPAEYREDALDELYAIHAYLTLKNEKEVQLNRARIKEGQIKLWDTSQYYILGSIIIGIVALCLPIAFEANNKLAGIMGLLFLLGVAYLSWLFIIKPAPENGENNRATMDQIHQNTLRAEEELAAVRLDYDKKTLNSEYYDIEMVSALISNIESGRADTIKEAINVYMDDGYKAEMKQIAINTQKAMESSARAAEQASKAASYNATISTLNFLLKK